MSTKSTAGQFELSRREIRAMLVTAAKGDIRHHLSGVLVETTGSDLILVSTDGHVMGVCRTGSHLGLASGLRFILPRKFLESVVLQSGDPIISMTFSDGVVTASVGESTVSTRCIEGKFPDWRRVVESAYGTAREPAAFNLALLARFGAVAKHLGSIAAISIEPSGDHASIVQVGHDSYIGFVMPMRNESSKTPPNWMAMPKAAA